MAAVWRITVIAVLMSILVHGVAAPVVMRQLRLRRLQAEDPMQPDQTAPAK